MRIFLGALVALALMDGLALAADAPPVGPNDLPNSVITPGAVRPGVTVADLCPVAHTPALRNVSEAEKLAVYRAYGMSGPYQGRCDTAEGCEIDHRVPLLLGSSNDRSNLWPESYDGTPWTAHVKDHLEVHMHARLCRGEITLEQAQAAFLGDWIEAYKAEGLPLPK